MEESFLEIVIALFIVINPVGNTPAILALIKDFSIQKQHRILAREMVLSLLVALFFLFVGKPFLELLQVADYTISLCGGIILFFVAMSMIFPHHDEVEGGKQEAEPFLIPIAMPLLAGPVCLTQIMLYAGSVPWVELTGAVTLSYILVAVVIMIGPNLNKLLGTRGLIALEQLMGLIMTLIAIESCLRGIDQFMQA